MTIFHVKRRIAIYAACMELAEENVLTISEYGPADRIRFIMFLTGGGA